MFINPLPVGTKEKTSEDVLMMVKARLQKQANYLKASEDERKKMTRGANLIVKRSNGDNIAIKIANETWKLWPITVGSEDPAIADEIENCIRALEDHKDQLYDFYKWVSENVGKKKDERQPFKEAS